MYLEYKSTNCAKYILMHRLMFEKKMENIKEEGEMMEKMKKKTVMVLILVLSVLLNLIPIEAHASSFGLNKTTLNMQYKEGYKLKTLNASGTVHWTSTNYDIAFVSREGFVRAKGLGTATVKATCKGKTVTCKVHVSKKTFKKYNLTNSQLKYIAAICYREQGTKKGAAAEASLMANLFESSRGNGYGSGGSGLYNYVRNSGWFGKPSQVKKAAPSGYATVVSKVLEKGIRTIPEYVDEHDCVSDITKITLSGSSVAKSSTSNYKSHKTRIYNVYGAKYYFYSFPGNPSDPFGYLSKSKRNKYGDFCYSYTYLTKH